MTGPRVVALGGGHGLAATLRAARLYAGDVTAIVSVADDGGSSGRLRDALGIPAPGDLRKCLVALAEEGSVWARAFEHRFAAGELEGHALGNLVIAGLAATTGGFLPALDEAARLVGAAGRVLPATTGPVVLTAQAGGGPVEGQVRVSNAGRISAVTLVPHDAEPPAEALEAIAGADQIVIGPGSLFTSIVAVLAVDGIREALARAGAPRIYIANLRVQRGETDGFDVAAHVDALVAHGLNVDTVLYDRSGIAAGDLSVRAVVADLAREDGGAHDTVKLAQALSDLVG